jgi:hypothetical protein
MSEPALYARFKKSFSTCQIKKHNGTGGMLTIEPNNIGVFNKSFKIMEDSIGTYQFDEVEGTESRWPYEKNRIVYVLCYELTKNHPDVEFIESKWLHPFVDEDQRENCIRFELRLLKAKTQIDVNVAQMYFQASEIDRLSIKESLMRLSATL